jgi:hypothetical protein
MTERERELQTVGWRPDARNETGAHRVRIVRRALPRDDTAACPRPFVDPPEGVGDGYAGNPFPGFFLIC